MIQEFGGDFAARTPGILKSRVSAITTAVSEAYDTSNFVWFKKWLFEMIETLRKVFFSIPKDL